MNTRRTFLRGLGALPAAAALPVLPALATPSTSDLADLWHRRLFACGRLTAILVQRDAAEKGMPSWAQPGPMYVRHDGTFCGEVSFAPAIQGYTLPEAPAMRCIRPDEQTIALQYPKLGTGRFQAQIDANKVKALAALAARRSAQLTEQETAGLPALDRLSGEAAKTINELDDAIQEIEAGTPDVLAAHILVEATYDTDTTDKAEVDAGMRMVAFVLARLLPHLTGELAEDAAEFVNNPAREMQAMRVSRGIVAGASL